MPGKPYSGMPGQRGPYVIDKINGKTLDKHGMVVDKTEVDKAYIPLKEFENMEF
ncbi:MAG: hypothetical protein MRY21_04030 [Simkaniaceae bacterium]|nr:hypothetical protein [Simkaniaceae bacterium]